DEAGTTLGSPGTGDQPEQDLWLAYPGVVGEVAEVRSPLQLQAPAAGEAAAGGDGRLIQGLQRPARPGQSAGQPFVGARFERRLETRDVRPRGEVGLPRDDDSPDLGVGAFTERSHQLLRQLLAESVHRRSVQDDEGDGPLARSLYG